MKGKYLTYNTLYLVKDCVCVHRRLLYDRHTAKCATLNAKTHCFTFRFVILEIGQGVTQHRGLKLNFYLKKGEDTSLSGVLCNTTHPYDGAY